MYYAIDPDKIVIDERARNGFWCTLPYPNHRNGCPNYGKKQGCPPYAKKFYDIVKDPFFLVIQEFDIKTHVQKMKKKHPKWTDRQCRNLLYWQKRVVKKLKETSYKLANEMGEEYVVLEVPEANGVDVFKTCSNLDIILERNPQNCQRIVSEVLFLVSDFTNLRLIYEFSFFPTPSREKQMGKHIGESMGRYFPSQAPMFVAVVYRI